VAQIIREKLAAVDPSDKIVRMKVVGVTEETLRTIPADELAALKQDAFSLNIQFEKVKDATAGVEVGRSGVGKIDTGFIEFIDSSDLVGFDLERLKREALKYLAEEG
jgi:hypothetical protein